VLQCITADGYNLPQFVILHRKTIAKNEMFHKEKDRMTADLMEDWVKS
jgi:hypothetical protein